MQDWFGGRETGDRENVCRHVWVALRNHLNAIQVNAYLHVEHHTMHTHNQSRFLSQSIAYCNSVRLMSAAAKFEIKKKKKKKKNFSLRA